MQVVEQRYEFIIDNMRCAACAVRLERVLNRHSALQAEVSFASSQATLLVKGAEISVKEMISLIEEAGFGAHLLEAQNYEKRQENYLKEKSSLKWSFILSALCSVPIMLLMMGPFWLVLILMTIVQFWCGRSFYKHAYFAVKNKNMTMDVLVVLGTSIAYFYDIFTFFSPIYLPFYPDASAMVISFVLLGRLLDLQARHQAGAGMESLLRAQPDIAHKEHEGGVEECAVSRLSNGDIIVIRPGEIVPVDGVILEGASEIDESLLTGEAVPVLRKEGDKIFAATLNHHAILRVEVQASGRKTEFSKIVQFVEKAQSSKAHIQKIADKLASYFVPFIIFCAALSFMGAFFFGGSFSEAVIRAVSVLVVACPCALGLATPMALRVGSAKGAELGLLFQDAHILERSRGITACIFDKTGTLTEGRPTVSRHFICAPYDEQLLFSLAFMMERDSEHPLGQAVREEAQKRALTLEEDFTSLFEKICIKPGRGILAELSASERAYIGTERFLSEEGVTLSQEVVSWLEEERKNAKIAVLIGWKGHIIGGISFEDALRKEAAFVISDLKKRHIMPVMVTGDHLLSAQHIGALLGIEQIKAGILPEGKAEIIRTLQKEGHIVGMVGDGLNDAPALAVADVSIAMGAGSALSLEAAEIILMRNNLAAVSQSLELAHVILRRIYQNFALALLYNIICIPLAAFGVLSPMLASICMAGSSLSVVLNALRLKFWHPKIRA